MESGSARKIMTSGSETSGNKKGISWSEDCDPIENTIQYNTIQYKEYNTSLHHRISRIPFRKDKARPEIELRDVDPPHRETGEARACQVHTMWKGEAVLFEGSRSREEAYFIEGGRDIAYHRRESWDLHPGNRLSDRKDPPECIIPYFQPFRFRTHRSDHEREDHLLVLQ